MGTICAPVVMRNQRSLMGQGKSDEHPPYEELTDDPKIESRDTLWALVRHALRGETKLANTLTRHIRVLRVDLQSWGAASSQGGEDDRRPSAEPSSAAKMGISRDSMHKRRATGGKKKAWRKKRKYELGRQPANTKLSSNKTVRRVRVRGGNVKWRALRLDTGNYSWGSEAVTRKTRILDVVYNASNNELVRTQTLVKSAIVQVDATPFKQWYLQHYGVDIGRKKKGPAAAAKKEGTEGQEGETAVDEATKSNHVVRKLEKRQQGRKLDPHIEDQFGSGRLLAAISSRPGQCGRADGYILEGKELEFYMKKIQKKKGKGAGAA
ncbi:hypothetical protein Taro_049847 [Colocasia esculenta]|uniref:40S ribosomal protein S8 n=1 Tax=Colocasia esculenta TaxID=4460 RepID=A0A843XC55_COLES|nr:hypothetical protein [Colocasia esculenta]